MNELETDNKGKLNGKVAVLVNGKAVEMPHGHATGIEIKEAAIAQGVKNVELDFQLLHIRAHERVVIGDGERIKLKDDEKFVMSAGDDNS